jgi:outer membrane biosynthesis protein TonB
MRATIVLLAAALLVVAVLVACRARDDSAADSATSDSGPPDGSAADSGVVANEPASPSPSVPRGEKPRANTPEVRRAGDPARDSTLPPEDSIRGMRPELPQVTPGKRPRTWRGFKLPEEMPVRAPVETIRQVEQVPDSVMKGDSTKPPKPDR